MYSLTTVPLLHWRSRGHGDHAAAALQSAVASAPSIVDPIDAPRRRAIMKQSTKVLHWHGWKAVTVPPQGLVQQVLTTIASVLDLDECQIAPQARLREDLGADSLDLAEMIVALGQALDITICDHEVCTITTVGEVLAYLAQPQPVHRVHHGRYLKEDDANDPSNDY
ncbi:MAG: phosphopantetheine-binding protein [Caldilineaceae bacterium]